MTWGPPFLKSAPVFVVSTGGLFVTGTPPAPYSVWGRDASHSIQRQRSYLLKTVSAARPWRGARGFALLSLFLLTAGCGGGDSGTGPTPPGPPAPPQPGWRSVDPVPAQEEKKWTFLVFMNAANDLEPFSGLNLNQMEAVGSTKDVNIVVQVKRIANRHDANFSEWKDTATRRFLVGRDNNSSDITSRLVEQNDSVDMGKAAALRDFVQWGVRTFPARRYALVLWNHGAGWRSAKLAAAERRGVSYDDVTGSHINTIELPRSIDIGRRWDLLAFDSSLMQMAEVAYEIRDQASYIAGSEESPPGEGYPYDAFLARLAQNPDMDGREFGTHIIRDTFNHYEAKGTRDITHSLLDASKVAAIAPAVDALGSALLGARDRHGAGIAQARDQAEGYEYPQNRDLLHFTQLLVGAPAGSAAPRVPDSAVQSAAEDVQRAVRAALVVNVNGRGHPNSQGLAIFLPSPSSYQNIDAQQFGGFGQRYTELAFTRAAPNWQAFLVQGPP